ncbi:MAG: hypothetical protein AAGH64_04675 [Planctomycetota bacterium]
MLAKLLVLILSLAALSASVLAVRQERLASVGEMAEALRRSERADRELWRIRVEIASRLAPDRLTEKVERALGETRPIMLDACERWCPPDELVHGSSTRITRADAPGASG